MKSKVLLTMLISFIVLAGMWVMCGTIFVVREVEVVSSLSTLQNAKIADQCKLLGKNILFSINSNKIKENIKNTNPMLRVQSITAEFPNKVVIKVSERLPMFADMSNHLIYDADLCVLDANVTSTANCAQVYNVDGNKDDRPGKWELQNKEVGNMITGVNARDQRKIDQLKVIAGHFQDVSNFVITFNDDPKVVGAYLLCTQIKINSNTTFVIKTKAADNFAYILAWTHALYKDKKISGTYTAFFDNGNKVVVQSGGEIYHEA